jgi:hypothetical protein
MSRQINLFDPGLRKRRPVLGAATMAGAFLVLVGAMAAYQQLARRDLAAAEAQSDAAATQLKALQAQASKSGASTQQVASKVLLDELARAEASVKTREQILERLGGAGVGDTQGHAKALEALARQHAEGVWLTGITLGEAGGGFVLQGKATRADLLPVYMQMLGREDALRGKAIGALKISEKTEAAAKAPADAPAQSAKGAEPAGVRIVEFSIGGGRPEAGG